MSSERRHKISSLISLFALIMNLIPFRALPAHAATIDLGTPAEQAHRRPLPVLVENSASLTPMGADAGAVLPNWFTPPSISKINYDQTAGLRVAVPAAIAHAPQAPEETPAATILPTWFEAKRGDAGVANATIKNPALNPAAGSVLPAWFAPANPADVDSALAAVLPGWFNSGQAGAEASALVAKDNAPVAPAAVLPGWFAPAAPEPLPNTAQLTWAKIWGEANGPLFTPPAAPLFDCTPITYLSVTIITPPTAVNVGNPAGDVFTVTVKNTGSVSSTTDVSLLITPPADYWYRSFYKGNTVSAVSSDQGPLNISPDPGTTTAGATFEFVIAGNTAEKNLAPGETITFVFKMGFRVDNTIIPADVRPLQAQVRSNSPAANCPPAATHAINDVSPWLAVTKTAVNSNVARGQTVTWTVTMTNTGAGVAYDAWIVDTVSGLGLTNLTVTPPASTLYTLQPGGVVTYLVTATASTLAEDPPTGYTNTVQGSWSDSYLRWTNAGASAVSTVAYSTPAACASAQNLSMDLILQPDPIPVSRGDTTGEVYTVTIKNNGSTSSNEVRLLIEPNVGFYYLPTATVTSDAKSVSVSQPAAAAPNQPVILSLLGTPAQATLDPGETITFTFRLATNADAKSAQLLKVSLLSGNPTYEVCKATQQNVPTARGNLVIFKTPTVQSANFGDTLTWTVELRNTGLGMVYDAVFSDFIGSGYTATVIGASSPVTLAPESSAFYTVTARVNACDNLTNSVQAWWSIGNADSTGTYTRPVQDQVDVQLLVSDPAINIEIGTLPAITYCSSLDTEIPVTLTNSGGVGRNLRLDNLSTGGLNISLANAPDWTYVASTNSFSYTPSTLPANSTVTFTVHVSRDDVCSLTSAQISFRPRYNDACLLLQVMGDAQTSNSATFAADAPTLNIDKTGPTVLVAGEEYTYTIHVYGNNPGSIGPAGLFITDTMPTQSQIQLAALSASSGTPFTVTNNSQVFWRPPVTNTGSSTYSEFLYIHFHVPYAIGCGAGSDILNTVDAYASTKCPQCQSLQASDSQRSYIQDPLVNDYFDISVAAPELEVCSDPAVTPYTVTAVITTSGGITWAGSVYTSGLGSFYNNGKLNVVPGSVRVFVNGVDRTAAVTVTAGVTLTIQLDKIGVYSSSAAITITYQVTADVGILASNEYNRQDFIFSAFTYGGRSGAACGLGATAYAGAFVTVKRSNLTISVQPNALESCRVNTVTLQVDNQSPGTLADNVVITLTVDSLDVISLSQAVYSGIFVGSNPAIISATVGGVRIITFTFPATTFNVTGPGAIAIPLFRPCGVNRSLQAGVQYQDQCNTTRLTGGSGGLQTLYGDVTLKVSPTSYQVPDKTAEYIFYVSNNGDTSAVDLVVTNTLPFGYMFDRFTVTGNSEVSGADLAGITVVTETVAGSTIMTFSIHNLPVSGRLLFQVAITVDTCADPTKVFIALPQSCNQVNGSCANRQDDAVTFEVGEPSLLSSNDQTANLKLCGIGPVRLQIKNTSAKSTLYNFDVTEIITNVTITGTPRVTVTNGTGQILTGATSGQLLANIPFTPTIITNTVGGTFTQQLNWVVTDFVKGTPQYDVLADRGPSDIIEITFLVASGCQGLEAQVASEGHAHDVCGAVLAFKEDSVSLIVDAPDVSVVKTGRLVSDTTFTKRIYASAGDEVVWKIDVANTGRQGVEALNVTDYLPENFTVTSVASVTTGGLLSGSKVIWSQSSNALAVNAVRSYYLTGTFIGNTCASTQTNQVEVNFGCSAEDDNCLSAPIADAATLDTQPDLALSSYADINPCNGVITITINNDGPPAHGVVLTDILPSNYIYVANSYTGSTLANSFTEVDSGTLEWRWTGTNTLPSGRSTLVFHVVNNRANGTCLASIEVQNRVKAAYENTCITTPFLSTRTNSLRLKTPELTVSKTPQQIIAAAGEVVSWTIRITNSGDAPAYNISITDTAHNGFANVLVSDGAGGDQPNTPFTATVGGATVITWSPAVTIAPGAVWQARVTATVLATGGQTNTVELDGSCFLGCVYSTTSDVAYVTLLSEFAKQPKLQTGTVGSLVVFTFTALLPDASSIYRDLTLQDVLPSGLGYVASELMYNVNGTTSVSSTPTSAPTPYNTGNLVWQLGDLPGVTQITGVVTATVRDISANYNGQRVTNYIEITYTDDGQPYLISDTAAVDIVEPLLHLGKRYLTTNNCPAELETINFNNNLSTGWVVTTSGTLPTQTWSVANGVYQYKNGGNARAVNTQTQLTDFSYSAMLYSSDSNGHIGLLFRVQDLNNYYRFRWGGADVPPANTRGLRLERVENGVSSELAGNSAVSYPPNAWQHIEVRAVGSNLAVYVNGQLVLSAVDTTFAGGGIGLYANDNNLAQFDDVLATKLGSAGCLVAAGDLVTYTLAISNQSSVSAYDLVVEDIIPAGLSLITYSLATNDASNPQFVLEPAVGATGAITWGIDHLTPTVPFTSLNHTYLNLTVVLSVSSQITANIQLANQALLAYTGLPVTGPLGLERSYSGGSHSAGVRTVGDNGLSKTVVGVEPPPTATIGSLVTYTLLVPAQPISSALYGVIVTDTLASRLTYFSATAGGVPGGQVFTSGQVITASYPLISPEQQAVLTITAYVNTNAIEGDVITNAAQMIHDTAPAVTASNVVTTVVHEPLLHLSKSYVTGEGCAATLLADNFNDGDSVGWSQLIGTFSVTNGVFRQTVAGNGAYQSGSLAWSDYSYSAMLQPDTGNTSIGLFFRLRDANNYSWFFWSSNGNLAMGYLVGGAINYIVPSFFFERPVIGRWYHVEVRAEGSMLSVYIDGVLRLQGVDPRGSNPGSVALFTNGPGSFDDVLVTRLGSNGCTVGAGSPQNLVTYTLTVSNQNILPGYNLIITDNIPAGMELVTYTVISNGASANITGPAVGARGVLTWTTDYLTPTNPFTVLNHTDFNIQLVLRVDDTISANTVLTNQAALSYDSQPGSGPAGVQRSYSGGTHATGVRTVDAAISKTVTFDPLPTATLGTLVTYTLIVPSRPITAALYGVVVTDQLNAPLFYIEDVLVGGTYTNAITSFNRTTGQITATFGAIPFNSQAVVTVTARISNAFQPLGDDPDLGDLISNTGYMTHATASAVTRTNVVTTVVGEPIVGVTKVVTSSTGSLSNLDGTALLTYTIRVTNNGTSPAYSIHITDAVPAGISVTQVLTGNYLATSGPVAGANALTWTIEVISNVAPANVITLTYVAVLSGAASASRLTNTVTVQSHSLTETIPGVRPYTTTASAVITTGRISAAKYVQPSSGLTNALRIGDEVTYTVVMTIPAGLAVYYPQLVDALPPGFRFISATGQALTVTPSPEIAGGQLTPPVVTGTVGSGSSQREVITWNLTSLTNTSLLAAGVISTVFVAQITGQTPGGVEIPDRATQQSLAVTSTNLVTVAWNITDTGSFSPSRALTQTSTVTSYVGQPVLGIVKNSTPLPNTYVGAGDLITYTLRITNSGHSPAYNIVITDALPGYLTYITSAVTSATPATITFDAEPAAASTGVITWAVNELWGSDPAAAGVIRVATITVVAQVSAAITANIRFTNTAGISYYDSMPGSGIGPLTPSQRVYTDGVSSVAHLTVNGGVIKTVTFDPLPTATLGTLVTYTLIVPSRPISAVLNNVLVTDTIDSRLVVEGVTWAVEPADASVVFTNTNNLSNNLRVSISHVPAYAQAYITVTARISYPQVLTPAKTGDIISNTGYMTHSTASAITSTVTVTTRVGEPSLQIGKAAASSTGSLSNLDGTALLTYTIRVTNSGTSPAYSIHITDAVPAGISVTQIFNGGELLTGNVISWTLASLSNTPGGNTANVSYLAVISGTPAGATRTNTVNVQSHSLTETIPGVRPYTTTASAVITTGRISAAKYVQPSSGLTNALRIGDEVTYTVVMTIPAGLAVYYPQLVDALPPGFRFISATGQALTVTPSPEIAGGQLTPPIVTGTTGSGSSQREVITWNLTSLTNTSLLAAGVISTVFVAQITGQTPGGVETPDRATQQSLAVTSTNLVTVAWNITDTGSFSPSRALTQTSTVTSYVGQPVLHINKTSTPPSGSTVFANGLITYTLRITNSGHSPAYDIVVTDTLPAGINYLSSAIEPATPFTPFETLSATGVVSWVVSALSGSDPAAVGTQNGFTITVLAIVSDAIIANQILTNTARIAYYDSQPDSGPQSGLTPTERVYTNGSSSVYHVTALASFVKQVVPPTATLGSVITYVLLVPDPTITATLSAVQVRDTLDGRLYPLMVTVGGGPLPSASGIVGQQVAVDFAQILSGQQAVITITAILSDPLAAVAGQVITNVAVLTHATGVTLSNQTVFTVVEPRVSISKTGAILTGNPQTALYTLTVANTGSSPAYDLNVVDTLPAGVVAVNTYGGSLINNERAISWTLPFLDVGRQIQLTYTARLTEPIYSGALFTNTAVVTSTSLTGTLPGVRPYVTDTARVVSWPLGRLGNYVWLDADYDGTQNENPITYGLSGVVVNLYNTVSGTLIATTTTNSSGAYYFDNLPLGVTYTVQLAPENFIATGVLSVLQQTRLNVGSAISDSNAAITATYLGEGYAVTTTLTAAVTQDLSLDFGFVSRMVLGNQVWFDTDNNGHLDTGEPAISNVVVILYQNVNGVFTPILSATTDSGGYYTFTNLVPGGYLVVITDSNFITGGALAGYLTSTVAVTGNSDLDNTNHGYLTGTPGAGGFVAGTVVTLTVGAEPQAGGSANLTLDFGFVRYDFGDLPDSSLVQQTGYATFTYPTTLVADGARHVVLPANNPTLGSWVDAEVNGQPSSGATGDDVATSTVGYGVQQDDDEDGVDFSGPLVPGETLLITVTAATGADGYLTGWIDFNGDGVLAAGERIAVGQFITAGETITLPVAVPLATAQGITTYARFRFSADVITQPTGLALSGEVEDYALTSRQLDWGDLPNFGGTVINYAPQTYPTEFADNGPRHIILPENNPTLGSIVDAEGNGQPSLNAVGDDTNPAGMPDDEDGVQFSGPLVPGETVVITVTAAPSASGYLNAWIDFNGDGVLDTGDQIAGGVLGSQPIPAGESIILPVLVPITAAQGITTYARFRFSSQPDLLPTGLAADGEVEDYALPVVPLDYGDLPAGYGTLYDDNGARHIIVPGHNPTLGYIVDAESNGQPATAANGDDLTTSPLTLTFGNTISGTTDDEDGVIFNTVLIPGQRATVTVRTLDTGNGGADGVLNGWIDFNGNGTLDTNERIITSAAVTAGSVVQFSFMVPNDAITGDVYSRFRYSSDAAGGSPTGLAADGEVEDYRVRVSAVDLGDLPDIYPTTLAGNGAQHLIDGTRLGTRVDAELDGQPSLAANLDDILTSTIRSDGGEGDDEDGVAFLTPVMAGREAQIRVTAGTTGYLNSWIDFDGDGALDVYTITAISGPVSIATPITSATDLYLSATGDYTITLQVPNVVISSSLYSRFRYTTNPGEATTPEGLAASGEVEDYVLLSLGDLVWRDDGSGGGVADDGKHQTGEPVISNVVLVLLDSAGITVTDAAGNAITTTTDAAGRYLFTGLAAGDYRVEVAASNFQAGGPLAGLLSSAGAGTPNTNADEDTDENGIDNATPEVNGIRSGVISLVAGTEPSGNGNSNLTLDFGFVPLDLGDLPDSYGTTLAADGPRHVIRAVNNPTLGTLEDAETDGQPSVNADGDNLANQNDEDGVIWTPLQLGQPATFTITTSGSSGYLNGWIDWNGNGAFDAGEQVFTAESLGTGTTSRVVNVPATATITGSIYLRFRYSTSATLTSTGFAPDGEVEDYVTRIVAYDLGDLPDSYGTTLAAGGARHQLSPTLYLGSRVDIETDGQPSVDATGDDISPTLSAGASPGDDEDGVIWSDLVLGQTATFTITASSSAGYLNGWIDWNGNGAFDAGEQEFTGQPLSSGSNALPVLVPATATITGPIYMRFRYSTSATLTSTGDAPDGEVEDYRTFVVRYDWGDLPDGLGTTAANNGPVHRILPENNPTLGSIVDAELDGQPGATATGDDLNYLDDEDGVQFSLATLIPGQPLVITVSTAISGADGYLNAWIDFNGDGVLDSLDRIANGQFITAGETITLALTVPTNTQVISAYARFRLSSESVLTAGGSAIDGEVEDYVLPVNPLDFGDLPDSYGTTLASAGARHVIVRGSNPTLGDRVDAESNGQPNALATGDDANPSTILVYGLAGADDEDGVIFNTVLIPGQRATVTVRTLDAGNGGADGVLNGWIDFNGNGVLDTNERIITNTAVTAGSTVQFSFMVPNDAITGDVYSRFRYSSDAAGGSPTGLAADGEVEDYRVRVSAVDLGDLPDIYPTTLAGNGAQHLIDGTRLGTRVDAELDGQPSLAANLDDILTSTIRSDGGEGDDEDGVVFLTPVMAGREAQIRVTAGTTGYLNSWFDFDGDGALDVYTITAISGPVSIATPITSATDIYLSATGDYTITLQVPDVVISSSLYSRFRYTSNPGEATTPEGLAASGEVEDYVLLSLGDLVWRDDGSGGGVADDGIHQSGEPVISNVVLVLLDSTGITVTDGAGNAITTTTDAAGRYLFSGLAAGDYRVEVAASNFQAGGPLAGLLSSAGAGTPNTNADEDTDENGIDNATPEVNGIRSGVISLAAGTEPSGNGNSNLTLDFGFVPLLSLGNLVWFDSNDNGRVDSGETGIQGVRVELYADTDSSGDYTPGVDQFLTYTVTLPGGIYTFTNLAPGGYLVVLTGTNFNTGGALAGYLTSTVAVTGNSDLNNTSHGYLTGTPGAGGFVAGTVVTLTAGTEPDDAGRANYTLDFGFVQYDFGDLPDSYGTTLATDGPHHLILATGNPTLGSLVDAESDGQPGIGANGDDTNPVGGPDDEDGVHLDSPLVSGQVATFTVTAANVTGAVLYAWIDWNGDGDFADTGEQPFAGVSLITGANVLTVAIPGIVLSDTINTRWRYSTDATGSSNPTGRAGDGEVEDHQYAPTVHDFGDLPDSYGTTLAANGPRHVILSSGNPTLGSDVDAELDGLPTPGATGDDADNRDDEDGVQLDSSLISGQVATFTVTAANVTGAALNTWIDWNGDGDFADAGEHVVAGVGLVAGANVITVVVPNVPLSTTINTRWRYSTDAAGSGNPTGEAANGEVEDHQYSSLPLDLGDLPEGLYPTTLANNGARHAIISGNNPTLGRGVDSESDGQPSSGATGDDLNPSTWYGATPSGIDDEDGVVWSPLAGGVPATVTVSALPAANGGRDGYLNAWIDFNGDGVLNDAGEQIAANVPISAGGSVTLNFTVPVTAASQLYSRFRFSSAGNDAPTGLALDGEVEDYVRQLQTTDFGDLPDNYGTTLANTGAYHIMDGTYLGRIVDAEVDGFPTGGATGDNTNGQDDEDGVVFLTPLVAGQPAIIRVTAGTTGYLNAWFDFDGDGTLDTFNITDINGTAVASTSNSDIFFNATGDYTITLQVPNVTISSSLYSRFRYTTYPGQANTPTGPANSGEVEDYVLLSLGNLVWRDDGSGGGIRNNGIIDGSEAGIPNVVLELRNAAGITVTDGAGNAITTTTDANGRYLFAGLPPASYTVFIPPSQFDVTGPLVNSFSSSPNVANPNNNADENSDENGLNNSRPDLNGITSGVINLSPGDEPSNGGNSNLTLDFGFVPLQPGITVDKQVTASPNVISATVTYTLRITNSGEITYTSLRVTDTLPAGINYAGNASQTPTSVSGQEVVWVVPGPIYPNDGITITFEAIIQTGITGTFTNLVTGTGIFTAGIITGTDQVPLQVVDPLLQVVKTLVATSTGLVTFSIYITNAGPSQVDNVLLFDEFAGPVVFWGSTPPALAYTNPTTSTVGRIVWGDLTDLNTPPFNAPHNLDPGEHFEVTTVFSITSHDTTFAMMNTAVASGTDKFTNHVPPASDRVTVIGPTAIDLLYFKAVKRADSILLRWATAVEVDTYGFRLLRSKTGQLADAVEVTFVPAEGGKSGGAAYEYADEDVTLGETYTYWLVDVDTAGLETSHGPATATFDGTVDNANTVIYLPVVVKDH